MPPAEVLNAGLIAAPGKHVAAILHPSADEATQLQALVGAIVGVHVPPEFVET